MYGQPTPEQVAAYTADDTPREAPQGVQGGRGPQAYGAAYEHVRRLQAHSARIAEQQRCRTYWATQAGEQVWRGLCAIPTWSCKPADESDEAKVYADHASACLGMATNPTGASWAQFVDETLTGALHGFALWSVWGEVHDGVMYARAESRAQGSILRWLADATGRYVGAEQQPESGFGTPAIIEAGASLLATYQPQAADDFSGVGLLRAVTPMYANAVDMTQRYMSAMQRWSIPTPDLTIDGDIAARCGVSVTPEWIDAELTKWTETVRLYVGHQQAYVARPPWVVLGQYGGNVTDLSAAQDAIDRTDRRILSVFYGQWLMLGTTGAGGAYSMTESQLNAARDHAQSLCNWIARVWSVFVRRCIEWRFGPVNPALLPSIQADGLSSETVMAFIAQVPALISSGALRVDQGMRDTLRRALELPAEDPATIERRAVAPGALVLPSANRGQVA